MRVGLVLDQPYRSGVGLDHLVSTRYCTSRMGAAPPMKFAHRFLRPEAGVPAVRPKQLRRNQARGLLVICLHSSMSWPNSLMAISQWNRVADENGFIVVYPEGTGFGPKSWEMAGSETPSRMPDVIFISQLIDQLEASYNIDKTRIYANGMSNGGAWRSCCRARCRTVSRRSEWFQLGSIRGWDWLRDHRAVPVVPFMELPVGLSTTAAAGRSRRRRISECPGLLAGWSRQPVRTEPRRIYLRPGCDAPAIHELR